MRSRASLQEERRPVLAALMRARGGGAPITHDRPASVPRMVERRDWLAAACPAAWLPLPATPACCF